MFYDVHSSRWDTNNTNVWFQMEAKSLKIQLITTPSDFVSYTHLCGQYIKKDLWNQQCPRCDKTINNDSIRTKFMWVTVKCSTSHENNPFSFIAHIDEEFLWDFLGRMTNNKKYIVRLYLEYITDQFQILEDIKP